MDIHQRSAEIGRELIRFEIMNNTLPSLEYIGQLAEPRAEGEAARRVARNVAQHIGKIVGTKPRTSYQQARALGVSRDEFVSWLRDSSENICQEETTAES